MLTISGSDWFSRRGGACRLHAIHEPSVYLYEESGRSCQGRPAAHRGPGPEPQDGPGRFSFFCCPRSMHWWMRRALTAYLASGRLVRVSARSNRRPRFGLYRFGGPITSADCCERRKCVAAIFAVRDALAHDEPHSGPNNSEREPAQGPFHKYGSGHLIRVFRDIGRISSLLLLLSHPSPVGHPLRRRVQKRKTLYGFVEGKNGFNCVSGGTHRALDLASFLAKDGPLGPLGAFMTGLVIAFCEKHCLSIFPRLPAEISQLLRSFDKPPLAKLAFFVGC
jgi:hypothetical protein